MEDGFTHKFCGRPKTLYIPIKSKTGLAQGKPLQHGICPCQLLLKLMLLRHPSTGADGLRRMGKHSKLLSPLWIEREFRRRC